MERRYLTCREMRMCRWNLPLPAGAARTPERELGGRRNTSHTCKKENKEKKKKKLSCQATNECLKLVFSLLCPHTSQTVVHYGTDGHHVFTSRLQTWKVQEKCNNRFNATLNMVPSSGQL